MFSNGAYATIWEVKTIKNEKTNTETKQVRLSTSSKKDDGSYEQDFSGFVRFVGKAKELSLVERDRVKLISVGVTNKYDKEKNVTYTNFVCFDAEKVEKSDSSNGSASSSSSSSSDNASNEGFMNIPDGIDDELPFN